MSYKLIRGFFKLTRDFGKGNVLGVGDGLGKFIWLPQSEIIASFPQTYTQWQEVIFKINPNSRKKWNEEKGWAQYGGQYAQKGIRLNPATIPPDFIQVQQQQVDLFSAPPAPQQQQYQQPPQQQYQPPVQQQYQPPAAPQPTVTPTNVPSAAELIIETNEYLREIKQGLKMIYTLLKGKQPIQQPAPPVIQPPVQPAPQYTPPVQPPMQPNVPTQEGEEPPLDW